MVVRGSIEIIVTVTLMEAYHGKLGGKGTFDVSDSVHAGDGIESEREGTPTSQHADIAVERVLRLSGDGEPPGPVWRPVFRTKATAQLPRSMVWNPRSVGGGNLFRGQWRFSGAPRAFGKSDARGEKNEETETACQYGSKRPVTPRSGQSA